MLQVFGLTSLLLVTVDRRWFYGVRAYSCCQQRQLNLNGNITTKANRKVARFLIKKITCL